MNMNVYALEKQMLQRKSELERTALTAWYQDSEAKRYNFLNNLASKLNFAKKPALKRQMKATSCHCCCCC